MGRRKLIWKFNGRRSQGCLLLFLTASTVAILTRLWWFSQATKALLPPVVDHDLQHFMRERNLKRYLDNIQLLIEPSSSLCEGLEEISLLVMVSSAPSHLESRMVIRHTWGGHLPTFFVLGLTEPDVNDQLVDIYIEAKQYSDMVVYDLVDHYQNLTLKTALMLQWTRRRCPQAEFLLKTDDDVLVNPWMMRTVLKEHSDQQIFGYKINNSRVHREEHSKWYMPRWLHPQDTIPEYLSGTGYIINAEFTEKILKRAYQTPLINLEDVYFTQLVAKTKLGMTLSHDRRLSPYRPWIRSSCALWGLATAHSLNPEEILNVWPELVAMGKSFENGGEVCGYFSFLSNDMFLF